MSLLTMPADFVTQTLAKDDGKPRPKNPNAKIPCTAADFIDTAPELLQLANGEIEAWRYSIIQILDNYLSAKYHLGAAKAATMFNTEPKLTGSKNIDAAVAGLAEYLADTDGWQAPEWVYQPARYVSQWYPDVPARYIDDARKQGVPGLAKHGIYVTESVISRA